MDCVVCLEAKTDFSTRWHQEPVHPVCRECAPKAGLSCPICRCPGQVSLVETPGQQIRPFRQNATDPLRFYDDAQDTSRVVLRDRRVDWDPLPSTAHADPLRILASLVGLTMTAVADEPEVLRERIRERPAEELGARFWNVVMDPSHSDSALWGSLMQENAFNQTTNHVFAGSRRESHLATMDLMSAGNTNLYDECVWHFDTEADRNERLRRERGREKRELVRLLAPQPEGRITNSRAERPRRGRRV